MREILFRGKRIDSGEWVYGDLLRAKGYVNRIEYTVIFTDPAEFPKGEYFGAIHILPETVGQFTGLNDKNGKRIFEGDIIKTHYANTPKADFIEQVAFHNGRFCGMYEHGKMKMWASLADGIKHLPQDKTVYMEWCEVIGNIHDNPELIAEVEG